MTSVPVPSRESAPHRVALLRELLSSLPAAVAYVSAPGMIVEFANDAYTRLVSGRETIGLPVREALPEMAAPGGFRVLDRVLRTGKPATGRETELWVRRDGKATQLFLDFVFQPVRETDGEAGGVLLYASDVTTHVRDRRRLAVLAAELTGTQERYRALFQTMPQGVIYYQADGTVIDANPAATEILGRELTDLATWPVGTGSQALREDGTPFPPEELPVSTVLRTGVMVGGVIVGITQARSGELRWLRVSAVPEAPGPDGRPQRAYVIFSDLTEQFRMQAELRERTSLLNRLRDANVLGMALISEQRIHEANDAFLDIVGYGRDDLKTGRLSYQALTPAEWAAADREALVELRRTGAFQPYEKEYRHRSGHRVPVLVGAAVVNRSPLRWVTFVVDLSAHQRAERERAELLVRERTARSEAVMASERLSFLLRAGALAAATRDQEALLGQVAGLVVPALADFCIVFLPTGDGMLRACTLTHRDPARAEILARLRDQPIPAAGPLLAQVAYTSGSTQSVPDVRAELPNWARFSPRVAAIISQIQSEQVAAIPLIAAQRPLGVMVLGRTTGREGFAAEDLEVGEELARRLAAGLANAETFAREHTIAETLQRSLLPSLPSIAGLDLAVRYLPATGGADVGGDWYDAFPVGGDKAGLVIGDVIGHSIVSASVMGQVRSMLRAYAVDRPSPREVLARTNLAMDRLMPTVMATVACALLDAGTGELVYASAGHPPALLIGPGGDTHFIEDTSGIMLGVSLAVPFVTARRRLLPGSALLFYTDGLIEDRQRDISQGLATLARTLAGAPGRTADEICAAAQDTMLGTASRADDVCLLAVRRPALSGAAGQPPTGQRRVSPAGRAGAGRPPRRPAHAAGRTRAPAAAPAPAGPGRRAAARRDRRPAAGGRR